MGNIAPDTKAYRRGSAVRQSVSKMPVILLIDGSTATSALANPVIATVPPTSGAINTEDFGAARIFIGGTDAADETINYQVILWSRFESATGIAYVPMIIAKGAATLGTLTYGVGLAMGATGNFLADTITETLSYRGVYITSPADNSIAQLEIDLRNAAYIEVQTDLGTAASADVLLQLGE